MSLKFTNEGSMQAANIGLAILRLKCFYETFVQGSTLGILIKFFAKHPSHLQAQKSSIQCIENSPQKYLFEINE